MTKISALTHLPSPASEDAFLIARATDGKWFRVKWTDLPSGGGGGTWGSITGTLSDQTDLQAALDAIPQNIDGGVAASVYTAEQSIDGGSASG